MKCPSCNDEVTYFVGTCSVCGKEVCVECWNPILGPEGEGTCNACMDAGKDRSSSGLPIALEKVLAKRGVPIPKVIPWNPYTLLELIIGLSMAMMALVIVIGVPGILYVAYHFLQKVW